MNSTRYDTAGFPTSGRPATDRDAVDARFPADAYSYEDVPFDVERQDTDSYAREGLSSRPTHEDLRQHRRSTAPLHSRPHDETEFEPPRYRRESAAPDPSVDRSSTVDPLDRIDEISALVEAARAVPMSANCMVNRNDLLTMLEELRADLPTEIRRAQALLDERDKIIAAGQREADRIIADGEHEHHRLVSVAEVTVSAEHEASRIIAEARAEAQRLRDEVEEYVDTTLANFEQMLQRTMATVERGRDKMRALAEIGSFDTAEEKPLPF